MPSAGRSAASTPRIAVSAARSASVTGLSSALVMMSSGVRESRRIDCDGRGIGESMGGAQEIEGRLVRAELGEG